MVQNSGWQSPGYVNDNLLKNWDFRQVVNQRGQTEYTGYGYCIDMWGMYAVNGAAVKCEIFSDHIRLTAGADNLYFSHAFETVLDKDTTYTVSIAFSKTKIPSITTKPTDGYYDFGNGVVGTLENGLKCHFVVLAGNTVDIYAAKLEVGTVSTLALDLMQPPNYAARLRECQRYLQIYDTPLIASAQNDWNICVPYKLNQEMRITPTFRYEGDIVIGDNIDSTIISDFEMFSGNTTMPVLRFTSNTGSFVKGYSYYIENLKLIFSAEL